MEHLRGVVERITYQNEENGFSVIRCRVRGYSDLVTVVGAMPEVHVGSVLVLGGQWKIDAKYGRQFAMETFEETLPATVYGIEKYLGSGLVKGIGRTFAGRIVRQFGAETLRVIEETPDRLLEVQGIGKTRVERIKQSWQDQKEIKNIMLFLQGHNVSTAHATKIYKTYGNESIRIVKENPYRLADDIWGIGFKTADTIAQKLGFGPERYERLRGGLLYTLNHLGEGGHCYATRDLLLKTGTELLSVEEALLSDALDQMILQEDVITEELSEGQAKMAAEPSENNASPYENGMETEDQVEAGGGHAIYLPPFYYAEAGTARRLEAIRGAHPRFSVRTEGLSERIRKSTQTEYDGIQLQAIMAAVESKILILTGGPGTGKTTTTLGILRAFQEARAQILLAAPTGRASKRLSEATGMEAKTIHRLLEYSPLEGYQRNADNPLSGDVLIVDECSMIDILLMYNLLKAVPDHMTLILVGDVDQLPSVGAGNVLRDLIDSDCFPVVRLTRIFRQAQSSRIVLNAHRVNEGKMPDISNGKTSDFFFMNREDPAEAVKTIVELVRRELPQYYRTPVSEIQVLTPMQRGVVGAVNLNQELQRAVNPGAYGADHAASQGADQAASQRAGEGSGRGRASRGAGPAAELARGGTTFRVGDKVMQIRNNYEKEIFNGDIGLVETVDSVERELTVRFDERSVVYDVSELDELVLAYATTIHKSQGSEYPIVVIPVLMNHYMMLQRNLIYTGITRAKKILVLVGTKKALAYAVSNVTVTKRNTLLAERIRHLKTQEERDSRACRVDGRILNDAGLRGGEAGRTYSQRSGKAGKEAENTERAGQGSQRPARVSEKPAAYSAVSKLSHEEWLKTDLFERIRASKFRMQFLLTEADKAYIRDLGMETIRMHAADLIKKRLAPAHPKNDGKQTPMRGAPKGHPVFLCQHATATCCRGCLLKWHGIPRDRRLTEEEQAYVVDVLIRWIQTQMTQESE